MQVQAKRGTSCRGLGKNVQCLFCGIQVIFGRNNLFKAHG